MDAGAEPTDTGPTGTDPAGTGSAGTGSAGTGEGCLLEARARVLHDLAARGLGEAPQVDVVDGVVSERRWWLDQWPEGAAYVAGQVAQDVQDRLLDSAGQRWPRCRSCDETTVHELRISPDLGPDPRWVCERSGIEVAPLGWLG